MKSRDGRAVMTNFITFQTALDLVKRTKEIRISRDTKLKLFEPSAEIEVTNYGDEHISESIWLSKCVEELYHSNDYSRNQLRKWETMGSEDQVCPFWIKDRNDRFWIDIERLLRDLIVKGNDFRNALFEHFQIKK